MDKNATNNNGHLPVAAKEFLRDSGEDAPASRYVPGTPFTLPRGPRLVALFEQDCVAAEKFRGLAARLRYLQKQRNLKRLLITSSIQGEGKSLIAANLALSLARSQKTLLIDGDLRNSGLKDLLGTHDLTGLSEWW